MKKIRVFFKNEQGGGFTSSLVLCIIQDDQIDVSFAAGSKIGAIVDEPDAGNQVDLLIKQC